MEPVRNRPYGHSVRLTFSLAHIVLLFRAKLYYKEMLYTSSVMKRRVNGTNVPTSIGGKSKHLQWQGITVLDLLDRKSGVHFLDIAERTYAMHGEFMECLHVFDDYLQ